MGLVIYPNKVKNFRPARFRAGRINSLVAIKLNCVIARSVSDEAIPTGKLLLLIIIITKLIIRAELCKQSAL